MIHRNGYNSSFLTMILKKHLPYFPSNNFTFISVSVSEKGVLTISSKLGSSETSKLLNSKINVPTIGWLSFL